MNMAVPLKTPEQIALSRKAGHLAAEVLRMIGAYVKPGVTTGELDSLCHDYIVNVQHAIPANVGYKGFPKTVCTSVNHVVCHGIPSAQKTLKKGDIVNIDVAVIKDGWFGDCSRMYFVDEPSPLARRLVETTYEAMRAGILAVRPGATLGDVGHAIQSVAHREHFGVVREYCGHGIGQVYHDDPAGAALRPAAARACGSRPAWSSPSSRCSTRAAARSRHLPDGWTVVTK
jgi:methionyl aminopeptidase